jgi:hypothetical protein
MTESDQPKPSPDRPAAADTPPEPGRTKRPYTPPVVTSSEMFYVVAGCGKTAPRTLQCVRIPRNS